MKQSGVLVGYGVAATTELWPRRKECESPVVLG